MNGAMQCLSFGVDITPPIGTLLQGYEEERISNGVHDRLRLKCLVLGREERVAIVGMDSLCVDADFVERLGRLLGSATGARHIVAGATHTHSGIAHLLGPMGKGIEVKEGNIDFVFERLEERLERLPEEWNGVTEFGSTDCPGLAANRIDPGKHYDPTLSLLRFRGDRQSAALASFACHPTVLPPSNLSISRDYVGYLDDVLESSFCSDAMFINGFAGNVSTRYTRKGQDFKEAERVGTGLARCALAAKMQRMGNGMQYREFEYDFRVRPFLKPAEIGDMILDTEKMMREGPPEKRRYLFTRIQGLKAEMRNAERLGGVGGLRSRISVMNIGGLLLATIPGEIFIEYRETIRNAVQGRNFIALGYTNDYLGYLPYRGGYDGESYEFHTALVETSSVEGCVERLADVMAGMT